MSSCVKLAELAYKCIVNDTVIHINPITALPVFCGVMLLIHAILQIYHEEK